MKFTVVTTLIDKHGNVVHVKSLERDIQGVSAFKFPKQVAKVQECGDGVRMVVRTLENSPEILSEN